VPIRRKKTGQPASLRKKGGKGLPAVSAQLHGKGAAPRPKDKDPAKRAVIGGKSDPIRTWKKGKKILQSNERGKGVQRHRKTARRQDEKSIQSGVISGGKEQQCPQGEGGKPLCKDFP